MGPDSITSLAVAQGCVYICIYRTNTTHGGGGEGEGFQPVLGKNGIKKENGRKKKKNYMQNVKTLHLRNEGQGKKRA
jgi:hypothetical protein